MAKIHFCVLVFNGAQMCTRSHGGLNKCFYALESSYKINNLSYSLQSTVYQILLELHEQDPSDLLFRDRSKLEQI